MLQAEGFITSGPLSQKIVTLYSQWKREMFQPLSAPSKPVKIVIREHDLMFQQFSKQSHYSQSPRSTTHL